MQQYNYKMKLEDVLQIYKKNKEEVDIIPKFKSTSNAFVRHLIVEDVDVKNKIVEFRCYTWDNDKTKYDKTKYAKIWMNIDDIAQLYVLNY